MTLRFYESPFHAVEEPCVANISVLKADLKIMIRNILEKKNKTIEKII